MKAGTQVEAELWALDKRMSKKNQNISTWTRFNVMQFASAYAYYALYQYLYIEANELPELLKLARLANKSKAELQAMYPAEKKSLSRVKLYQIARKHFLEVQ